MKFSITIPAYKQKYLKECIDSILSQTYTNFELVIVNDASPEDLDSIVYSYSDPRIRYFTKKNCGAINVVDNWNICLSYATGDYIICMGDDDKLLSNCLEEYNTLINKHPDIGLLHGWTEIIDENSSPIIPTTHRCQYESALSLIWHRQYVYRHQYIGDFCFNRQWLLSQGGFYKLPLAWGSDNISAFIGAMKNGVLNTQTIVFQYRINPLTISSTGNVNIKLRAIESEYKWLKQFISYQTNNEKDELYRKDLIHDLNTIFDKKKGQVIAKELKVKSIFRIFYWLCQKKKYKLNNKTIIYSFIQALK